MSLGSRRIAPWRVRQSCRPSMVARCQQWLEQQPLACRHHTEHTVMLSCCRQQYTSYLRFRRVLSTHRHRKRRCTHLRTHNHSWRPWREATSHCSHDVVAEKRSYEDLGPCNPHSLFSSGLRNADHRAFGASQIANLSLDYWQFVVVVSMLQP